MVKLTEQQVEAFKSKLCTWQTTALDMGGPADTQGLLGALTSDNDAYARRGRTKSLPYLDRGRSCNRSCAAIADGQDKAMGATGATAVGFAQIPLPLRRYRSSTWLARCLIVVGILLFGGETMCAPTSLKCLETTKPFPIMEGGKEQQSGESAQPSEAENKAPVLKYADSLAKIKCKLNHCSERNRKAFRWIKDPLSTERNHRPQAINNPKARGKNCEDWALSCYDSYEQASTGWEYHIGIKERLVQIFGEHIVETDLVKSDGVSEDSRDDGHFNHHEYDGYDIADRIISIRPAKP